MNFQQWAWTTIGVTLCLFSWPSPSSSKVNTCLTFRGRRGDTKDPEKWLYEQPAIKTKDLTEVDLPEPVVTRVIAMVDDPGMEKIVEVAEWEGSDEEEDILGYPRSEWDPPSETDCIPRPANDRRKRAAGKGGKKKSFRCVWKKKKRPYCDELKKLPRDKRKPIKFIIERTTEKKNEFFFRIWVNESVPSSSTVFTEDREYYIKVSSKKMYTVTMGKIPNKVDKADWKDIDYLYRVIQSFYGQSLDITQERFYFDAVTTFVWDKVDGHYRLVEINSVMIKTLEDLCGDTLPYISYRRRITSKEHAKLKEITVDIISKDSKPYEALFRSEDSFRFKNWFRIYANTVLKGDVGGGENLKVVESYKHSETGQLKFIKIIWDVTVDVKSFTMVAILFSKDGGLPTITIKDFGSSNKGVAEYKVLVQFFTRTTALVLKVEKLTLLVRQGEEEDDDAGDFEMKFNYTYTKKTTAFNYTAQSSYIEDGVSRRRKRRGFRKRESPSYASYWNHMVSYLAGGESSHSLN